MLAYRHIKWGLIPKLLSLGEGFLMVLLDPRYTQVGFNLISVQVWTEHRIVRRKNCSILIATHTVFYKMIEL